ncbi:HAD family hydrolase [Salicola sp. Rm-C-2C1-2]|uniref:HAD family hydrolase n=1 Tax=Salicola sp. Rm-C-2C1-2 TaxID=3141321 RepID=UPI0032E4C890
MNWPDSPTPELILFDWHGTLVDTHDAMFSAMEEMLPRLEELGLVEELLPEEWCKTADDTRLVRYIRLFRRLHPRILSERRVSRTDIFNAIFGNNTRAKQVAHEAYNACYRHHYGEVTPFQEGIGDYLRAWRAAGIQLGIATNRNREFLERELTLVDSGLWQPLIDLTVCAGDITAYKPDPDIILKATEAAQHPADARIWYIGDSTTDMITAGNAGVTPVFFNGGQWEPEYIERRFSGDPEHYPVAIAHSFEALTERIAHSLEGRSLTILESERPAPYPAPKPPDPRVEPDWHPSVVNLTPPRVILFDWHATLVDTLDAMYHAVDDMLPELRQLGLLDNIATSSNARSPEEQRLVDYARDHSRLHPQVQADRKISRTDIFEVLFGEDDASKNRAHEVFRNHYRRHYGAVLPLEPRVRELLSTLNTLALDIGVITNRDREFFEDELRLVDGSGWEQLFTINICGDDVPHRKPHPDQLLLAAERLGEPSDLGIWYVGDSTTDVSAARRAGQTAVLFNSAQWDLPALTRLFPADTNHPYRPDVVVNDFSEFWAMLLACMDTP